MADRLADGFRRRLAAGSINRRGFVGGAAATGLAAAAAGLVGCSSSNGNTNSGSKPAVTATSAGLGTTATSAAGGAVPRPSSAAAVASPTPAALDSTKGKPGGTLKEQEAAYPPAFTLVDQTAACRIAGLVHSGLLGMRWCVEGVAYNDYSVEPDAAQAMPEQPDQTTYTFKLRPGIKFHNGRVMTSQDVQYSFDRYAQHPQAIYSVLW